MTSDQPVVSVDTVALRMSGDALHVLLITRQYAPYAHRAALPGVMLVSGETASEAARRALAQKAGVDDRQVAWHQAGRYNDTRNRDPRGATISLTQIALLRPDTDDEHIGRRARFVPADAPGTLPFAHNEIVSAALEDVRVRVDTDPLILPAVLGEPFSTVAAARLLTALGAEPDTANLARRLALRYDAVSGSRPQGRGRPARLWQPRSSEAGAD